MNSIGTALVTGASSGIGALYADRLSRRGYDLVLVARDEKRLADLAARVHGETGRAAEVVVADLTVDQDVDRVAERLSQDAAINLLVNNAGMSLHGGLLDEPSDALRRLVTLNSMTPMVLAAAAAKVFAGRASPGIINIGSVLCLIPEKFEGAYSATKAFLLNMSLSLAAQLEGKVKVQIVIAGATRTEIWERSGKDVNAFPPQILMEAGDLVDAAMLGFERGERITIPSLADESLWKDYERGRLVMAPVLNNRSVAARYV